MRTTIDLRPELHRKALSLARDSRRTLSETVNDLLAKVLEPAGDSALTTSPVTGLTVVRVGHPVSSEDVRSLEDD